MIDKFKKRLKAERGSFEGGLVLALALGICAGTLAGVYANKVDDAQSRSFTATGFVYDADGNSISLNRIEIDQAGKKAKVRLSDGSETMSSVGCEADSTDKALEDIEVGSTIRVEGFVPEQRTGRNEIACAHIDEIEVVNS